MQALRTHIRHLASAALSLALAFALLPAIPGSAGAETRAGATDSEGTVRILCIGNSWTQRSIEYLCSIARSAGKHVIVGHPLLSSSSLQEQYFSLLGGDGQFVYNGTNRKVRKTFHYHKYVDSDVYTTRKTTLAHAIADEPWDYVVLQNRAPESGNYATWDKDDPGNSDLFIQQDADGGTSITRFDVNDFVDLIEQHMDPDVAANVKVGLSAVWSYAPGQAGGVADSIAGYIRAKRDGKLPHTQKQWNAVYEQLDEDIQETIPKVAAHMESRCDFVVNPGLAFRYARGDAALSAFGYKLHVSPHNAHPATGIPCYIAGLTYAFAILGIGWQDVGFYPTTKVTSYRDNAKGGFTKGTAKPTARLALRALACSWQAQTGSRIDVSASAASPLYSRSSTLSKRNTPSLKVKPGAFGTLEQKKDFKITKRKADADAGTLTIGFKGIGRFRGSSTRVFELKPAKVDLKAVKAKRSAAAVSWDPPKKEDVSGIQIRLWKKRGGSYRKARTVDVSKPSQKAKTVTGLASGKRYRVRVRAYRLVAGKKYAGPWSARKTVKIR